MQSTGLLVSLDIEKTKNGDDYKLLARKLPIKIAPDAREGLLAERKDKRGSLIPETQSGAFKSLIREKKEKLTSEERRNLREEAINLLKSNPDIVEALITEPLIELTEDELFSKNIFDK